MHEWKNLFDEWQMCIVDKNDRRGKDFRKLCQIVNKFLNVVLKLNNNVGTNVKQNSTCVKASINKKTHQKNYFNPLPNSRINPYAINFLPHLGGPAMHIDFTLAKSMSPSPNVHCRKRYFTSPRLCGGDL